MLRTATSSLLLRCAVYVYVWRFHTTGYDIEDVVRMQKMNPTEKDAYIAQNNAAMLAKAEDKIEILHPSVRTPPHPALSSPILPPPRSSLLPSPAPSSSILLPPPHPLLHPAPSPLVLRCLSVMFGSVYARRLEVARAADSLGSSMLHAMKPTDTPALC